MKTPSTKKLLIINAILLSMILAVLLILKFDILKKRLGSNPDEIYETDNLIDTQEKHYPKQDTLQVDNEGLMSDTIQLPDGIIETMSTELDSFNWNEEFQEESLYNIYHETVFAQQFPTYGSPLKKLVVIIFSNYGGNHCHASSGRISLFEFQKEHKKWQMTRHYIAFGYGNEYGLEPLGCKLMQIGNNLKYALIVQTSYSGQGHEKESQLVYTEVNQDFELVFNFTNYEYYYNPPEDVKYFDGNSSMRILKSDKAWFDIETKSDIYEWNDHSRGAVKHFEFNGKEYVETNKNVHLLIQPRN